jgi:CRP-like cAMP-binding protein
MDETDLSRLREVGMEVTFPPGHMLIERGQSGAGLFLILDGTVVVEAPEGTRDLGPGALVGERALLSADGRRTARVLTTSEVSVLVVDRGHFDELCAADPSFASRLEAEAAAQAD